MDLHKLIRELKSKKNVEENLLSFVSETNKAAFRFAKISLSFYFLTLSDNCLSGLLADEKNAVFAPELKELGKLLNAYLSGKEVDPQKVEALRVQNRALVENITKAVDQFTTLEYVLNRVEHRFVGQKSLDKDYSDYEKTHELITYLGNFEKDAQNLAVMRILEQLPVRLTKNKFYETVSERLSIYKEGEVSSFLSMVDSIKSASGINDGTEEVLYPELNEIYQKCSGSNFEETTRNDFESLQEQLANIGETLNLHMDLGSSVQEVLNAFEVVVLSKEHAAMEEREEKACDLILNESYKAFSGKKKSLNNAYEACSILEGKLEESEEEYRNWMNEYEVFANDFEKEIASGKIPFDQLYAIFILCSNSAFADVEKKDAIHNLVTDKFFNEVTLKLNESYAALFATLSRPFIRGIMARVFSLLPPRFQSQEDLENFIYESLSACHDEAEKLGCLEIIENIMRE